MKETVVVRKRTVPPSPEFTLITREETSKRLGIKRRTLEMWVAKGIVPKVAITAKVVRFFWPDVLKALLERQTRRTP